MKEGVTRYMKAGRVLRVGAGGFGVLFLRQQPAPHAGALLQHAPGWIGRRMGSWCDERVWVMGVSIFFQTHITIDLSYSPFSLRGGFKGNVNHGTEWIHILGTRELASTRNAPS